ncbi:hypothetical protein [Natrialba asiatica]|uniref:Uncharacterized protein n=1 Tax=Natrialba asiatica (strain ATCC 700177 / DSM 12278 / JCM 9576 / FERM P-10747 / NBRC 102637 / 172P1) TaxID=29540 RepID=M0B225_NATA1|nr:hypothetical protein [Natrialba asiatica]ELZ04956.1 hypothetical protein C481_03367 [Natrialba asiatica DSM 12278]
MPLHQPRDPKGKGYPWGVRVTVAGIDCYSVGAESKREAGVLKTQMEAQDGVSDAEVVRYA